MEKEGSIHEQEYFGGVLLGDSILIFLFALHAVGFVFFRICISCARAVRSALSFIFFGSIRVGHFIFSIAQCSFRFICAVLGLLYLPIRVLGSCMAFCTKIFSNIIVTNIQWVFSIRTPKIRIPALQIEPPLYWKQWCVGFMVLGIALLSPFSLIAPLHKLRALRAEAFGAVERGMAHMSAWRSSLEQKDLPSAQKNIADAVLNFDFAKGQLHQAPAAFRILAHALPQTGSRLGDRLELLAAADEASRAGMLLTESMGTIFGGRETSAVNEYYDSLETIVRALDRAVPLLQRAFERVQGIAAAALPEKSQVQFNQKKAELGRALESMKEAHTRLHQLGLFLGKDEKKRYMLIFQNMNELRPTGGFAGSFALLDVYRGALKKAEIPGGGSYDLQGALLENRIPPVPLRVLNDRWEFQDANWFPDFPTSAKKFMSLHERAGGSTVDGLCAMNATLLPLILEYTGPIALPEYALVLTRENAIRQVQNAVEHTYDKTTNRPKQLLADLFPRVVKKLESLSFKDQQKVALALIDSFARRDIQCYATHPDAQNLFEWIGIDGAIQKTSGDYIMVVDSNMGGGKTDEAIDASLQYAVESDEQNRLFGTVIFQKRHRGNPGEAFVGTQQLSYMRFYAPRGSVFVHAQGIERIPRERMKPVPINAVADDDLLFVEQNERFDATGNVRITDEFEKTAFGVWMSIQPGTTKEISLTYALPFTLSDLHTRGGYTLLFQRQSGSTLQSVSTAFPAFAHLRGDASLWKRAPSRDEIVSIQL